MLAWSLMEKMKEMSDSRMEWLNYMISRSRLARIRELKAFSPKM